MAKRHKDALAIQGGACNPVAIVNSIQSAIEEVRAETPGWDAIRQDPAIRLMLYQLGFLCQVHLLYSGSESASSFAVAMDECQRLAD